MHANGWCILKQEKTISKKIQTRNWLYKKGKHTQLTNIITINH